MQGKFAIFNGTLFNTQEGWLQANRSFHYGDGLFETIRVFNGKAVFLGYHLSRLTEGMKILQLQIPQYFTTEYFQNKITELIEKNNIKEGARIRLTVFRNNGGYYSPTENEVSYTLESNALPNLYFSLNEDGLIVDLYTDIKKQINKLSIYKTCNSLLYIMAALWAKQNKLTDALVLNDKGNIIESSHSNIFVVSNGVLYTPSLTDGCLAGIQRMQVINLALQNKIKVYECSITPQNLLVADEVFLSNAIQGIQWIQSYRQKHYVNTVTKNILALMNDFIKQTIEK